MLDIATAMSNVKSTDDIDLALSSLVRLSLPLPIHWEEDLYSKRVSSTSPRDYFGEREIEPIVFLDFKINGKNIKNPTESQINKAFQTPIFLIPLCAKKSPNPQPNKAANAKIIPR